MHIVPFSRNRFTPSQHGRYDLQSQIFETVCQVAGEQGIISQELLQKFGNIRTVPDPNESVAHRKAREAAESAGSGNAHADANLLNFARKFRAASTPDEQRKFFKQLKASLKLQAHELNQLADLM